MNHPVPMLKIAILTSAVALGIGVTAPTITINPGAGGFTFWVELFAPQELTPKSFSILGVIGALFKAGDLFLAIVLATFSLLFPISKLGFYWLSTSQGGALPGSLGFMKGVDRLGKFSMAEVFLLALIAFTFKALPGDTSVRIEYGAYVFFTSVISSLIISIIIGKNAPAQSPGLPQEKEPVEEESEEDTGTDEPVEDETDPNPGSEKPSQLET